MIATSALANGAVDCEPTPPINDIVDPTMLITDDERTWALEIKQAVEDSTELDNICDMFYAQYAIINQGDLPKALRMIQGMQTFRRTYKIDDSIEQGVHYLRKEMSQQPGFLLTVNIDVPRQISYISYDCGALRPDVAMGHSRCPTTGVMQENWVVLMAAAYYKKYACQPSLATVRNGFTVLADFGDYDWNNFSLEMSEGMFGELLDHYPMVWNHFFAYNTGTYIDSSFIRSLLHGCLFTCLSDYDTGWTSIIVQNFVLTFGTIDLQIALGYLANILFGLAKQVMTPAMKESVQLGCQIIEPDEGSNSGRRLKDFYYQPSQEVAEGSILDRTRLLLTARRHNEETFRL